MSPARNYSLEDIIRRYIEAYPERVDLLVTLMEFWARLHSLNENVTSLLREVRQNNAEQQALCARVAKTIDELSNKKYDKKRDDDDDDDEEEGAAGGQRK